MNQNFAGGLSMKAPSANQQQREKGLPVFGGAAKPSSLGQDEHLQVQPRDPDEILATMDSERTEIEEFQRATDHLLTKNADLKDILQNHMPPYVTRLQAIKKLYKSEKHGEEVVVAVRSKIREVVKSEVGEALQVLKALMLVRHVCRSIREKSIRAMKQLFKICPDITTELVEAKLPIYIIFILEREFRSSAVANERKQSFKLISAWLNNSPENFPLLFAQSIISIVRNEEEFQLRFNAIDLLILMCSKAPRRAAQVGGFKQLIESVIDPSLDGYRYDRISHALMLLINDPRIRIFFRPVVDLNRIFNIFTRPDGVNKDPHPQLLEKIQQQQRLAKNTIVNMMRSWQGVIYLTSSPLGLKSLVEALNQPIREYKKIAIMDIFIEIFNVPIFIGGSDATSSSGGYMLTGGNGKSDNLLNNYVALLLQAFYHSSAYDALTRLGTTTEEGSHLNKQSKSLLKKIIYLSSYLLPEVPQFAALIQLATDFSQEGETATTRTRATKLVKELSSVALRNPLEHSAQNEVLRTGQTLGSRDFSPLFMHCYEFFINAKVGLPNNQVISYNQQDLKTQYYNDIDETKYQAKVKATRILSIKDWRKWDWPTILELCEGNLINTSRLEALQRTKFIKRLLNFYLPSKQQFICLKWRQENFIYAKVGYHLIKRLSQDTLGRKTLSSPEGVFHVLGVTFVENQDNIFHHKKSFLQDIRDLLEKEARFLEKQSKQRLAKQRASVRHSQALAPEFGGSMVSIGQSTERLTSFTTGAASRSQVSNVDNGDNTNPQQIKINTIGATSTKRFFTKQRVSETMVRELISWLGILSSSNECIKGLLIKFKIFDYLEQLIDRDGYYDHFTQIVLNSFSFEIDSPSRRMMKKWVNVSSQMFTKSLFEYVRLLHRSGLHDFYKWCLPFLTNHTSIQDRQISASAFDVIEESCYDELSLNYLLEQMDTRIIQNLQRQGDLFVAKFLRSEIGFYLLHSQGWVDTMLDHWVNVGNYDYIARVEQSMFNGLSLNQVNGQDTDYAMEIWLPIYEHSNDFRSELAILKRFPFQIMLKVESDNFHQPIIERMQTYFDIGPNNELQIVGRLIKNHSKVHRMSLEELGNAYISVCTKLGDSFVDSKCRAKEVESWTMSQIDSQLLERIQRSKRQKSFFVMKDGINFCFSRQDGAAGQGMNNITSEFFLDQVVQRVKILPVKYKTIKNPIHFYGELVKTKAGADFLRQKNHLELFRQDILSQETSLLKKRAALWAVGHIGSNEHGISLIQEQDLIQPIVNLAENADFLSLRGTCIYIIGMLSNTTEGKKEILQYDWIASRTKSVTSVCLPKNPQTLFNINIYEYQGTITNDDQINEAFATLKRDVKLNDEEQEVVKNISNLLNSVYEMQSISDLRKKIETKPEIFTSVNVFEHVSLLLQVYRFRPKARKFLFNLFETLLFNNDLAKKVYFAL